MTLTNREKLALQEIRDWEKNLYNYEANDFQLVYDKYIEQSFQLLPDHIREQISSSFDSWLFHLHAFIQGTDVQMDAKERILSSGRVFQHDIQTIEDMKALSLDQLQYIASQHIARHRIYSFAQGGVSGTGETLLLGADIPGMAVINIRSVQLIAMTYGTEVNIPYEMMTALKVFNASLLPQRLQRDAWQELVSNIKKTNDHYFYDGKEELANVAWMEQLMKQLLKGLAIVLFRKKIIQGIPMISMAIGAGANYKLTRKVTEFTHKYYQMRYLLQKKGDLE